MKTAIIGLDGATFDLIRPLAEQGRLPVLKRLMDEGTSAPLRSTILPNSFPGWSSCTTGTSEGMHGVFSPFIKQPSSYTVRAMSGLDIMTRPIWDMLTENGGRSLLVNIPTTYPPEPLGGVMITGMLTPSLDSEFTYPPELKEEMLAAVPAYVIEPGRNPNKKTRAAEFSNATDMHELAAHFLMDRGDWDFLMIVFSVLDRAQHDFWADMDPAHPRHDPKTPDEFRTFIPQTYEKLDSALGRLIEKLPADSRVFVVSDHGFCSELKEIRVNEALAAQGLLTFKSPGSRKRRARTKSLTERITRRLGLANLSGNVLDRKVQAGGAFLEEIDWEKTRAYFAQDKGIWVNLTGREPSGIVSEREYDRVVRDAIEILGHLKDPQDAAPVFEKVMPRGEAFTGRFSHRLPDVVMIPRRDEYVYNERPAYGEIIVDADSTTGTHSRDGILISWGRGIKAKSTFGPQPNLRDIGPTALHSLGCPLTTDMDGRLLAEMFSDQVEPSYKGSSYRASHLEDQPGSVYTESEEAGLKERLRALGYIE
jgi:predicted AlkP superfamily phosphohydrolase/phosphomutase